MLVPDRVAERFMQRFDVPGPDDCWTWKGAVGTHGYGYIGWWDKALYGGNTSSPAKSQLAHRIAWDVMVGPIPPGMTIDHICRNRLCQNPSHLRLLPNVDNARMNGYWAQTHCKRGHAFTPENTRTNDRGHRWCRACQRARDSKRLEEKT